MNYNKTLDYLFKQLPMYQRLGKAAYKVDLNNTHLLCKLLNHPEKKIKTIHIAGTNGKGSTSHMLASILQTAGYKVGLYTSPHLKNFRERIKINGKMISEDHVQQFVSKHKTDFEKINLSFFEWTVGLAFSYFYEKKTDINIIETGLGGRLDSTNVIQPEISIITNIGLDHTQFLGTTLSAIAKEKAGIIKENTPVIIGESHPETKPIFNNISQQKNSNISFADETHTTFSTDLKGSYQQKNIKTCVTAIKVLINLKWNISQQAIEQGLLNVVKNTELLGRWQILNNKPLTICDVGHNEAGIKEILTQLTKIKYENLHIVFGTVNDKSVSEILTLLPQNATYYFCEANIPRALPVKELTHLAKKLNLKGENFGTVKNAISKAKHNATTNDLIFIGGSTFVVAEAL